MTSSSQVFGHFTCATGSGVYDGVVTVNGWEVASRPFVTRREAESWASREAERRRKRAAERASQPA